MSIRLSSTGLYLDFIRFTFSIHFRLTICKVKNFLLKYSVFRAKASVSFHFLCIVFIQVFHRFQQGYEYTLLSLHLKISVCTGMKGDSMKKRRFTQISAIFNL